MNDVIAPQPGKPSRRTVLVGAAWSVPVIAAAAAAPQVAASGEGADLTITNVTASKTTKYIEGHSLPEEPWWVNGYTAFTGLEGNLKVGLLYAVPDVEVTSITVTLTVTDASGLVAGTPTVSGTGWSAVSGTISGSTATYVFSWTGSIHSQSTGYTSELQFSLAGDGISKLEDLTWPKTVSAVATSPTANSDSASTQVYN